MCWFVDWQAGRAGNSIFEHVCQKKAVDLLIGRPAELVFAMVYVRENALICWLAGRQSWQFDFRVPTWLDLYLLGFICPDLTYPELNCSNLTCSDYYRSLPLRQKSEFRMWATFLGIFDPKLLGLNFPGNHINNISTLLLSLCNLRMDLENLTPKFLLLLTVWQNMSEWQWAVHCESVIRTTRKDSGFSGILFTNTSACLPV